jgi:hypothetical protein
MIPRTGKSLIQLTKQMRLKDQQTLNLKWLLLVLYYDQTLTRKI